MRKWIILIVAMMVVPQILAAIEVQHSLDNATWRNFTTVDEVVDEATQIALQQDTLYYVRARNTSSEWGYTTQRTKEGVEDVWVLAALLAPIFIAFFFIYLANSLDEEQIGMKMFLRFIAFAMLWPLLIGINIVSSTTGKFPGLTDLIPMAIITWSFWLYFGLYLIMFLLRLFNALKENQDNDFDQGIIR